MKKNNCFGLVNYITSSEEQTLGLNKFGGQTSHSFLFDKVHGTFLGVSLLGVFNDVGGGDQSDGGDAKARNATGRNRAGEV